MPFVLRQTTEEPNEYVIVGEYYVHRLMDGEAFDSGVSVTDIVLV